MLSSFDWIRLCQVGAELIATLDYLNTEPGLFTNEMPLGAPFSAFGGPCQRCRVYAPASRKTKAHVASVSLSSQYCQACRLILSRASSLSLVSRRSIVIWGYVNQLPRYLKSGEGFYQEYSKGQFILDQNRFLLLLHRRDILSWLQELALYHGPDLKGHLQIFPTIGRGKGIEMGEMICRAMHLESRFAMDRLWLRFYVAPHYLLRPQDREKQGILTFETPEFVNLLEMATVFKSVIYPDEQKMLHELLQLEDPVEKKFYWGRFLSFLHQEAKDMLTAWNIRQWSENRVKLLYELIEYVAFEQTY